MTEQNQSETTTQPKKQRRSPNADKWGVKVMEQGFCMIPSLLLRAQQRLHLSPSQLAVLLQILFSIAGDASLWHSPENK